MMEEKIKEGDIRPVFQQVGWEICKKASEKKIDQIWVQTDKQSEAEMMSFIFKNQKSKE